MGQVKVYETGLRETSVFKWGRLKSTRWVFLSEGKL